MSTGHPTFLEVGMSAADFTDPTTEKEDRR